MATTKQAKKGDPGFDLEMDLQTLDSLIDGEPDDDGLGSTLHPIRVRLAKALDALRMTQEAIDADADDEEMSYDIARDLVAEALGLPRP